MASSSSSEASTLNQEKNSTRDLPDDVLQHIFSYLDMNDVLCTSIFAKRWRYFWASLPFIYLDEKVFNSNPNYGLCGFSQFVTRVLLLRDRSIIHVFRLRICSYSINEDMDVWMQSVLKCNVQQLSIEYYNPRLRECFDTPFVFKSKFLTKLHIGSIAEGDQYVKSAHSLEVRLPNSIDLPVLVELRLEAICNMKSKDVGKLFAGCPVLETLEIINCEFGDFSNSLTISALQLKHLVIQFGGLINPYECILRPLSITVSSPNLISFRCRDYMSRIYHLDSLSKLEIADMSMEAPDSIYNPEFLVDESNGIDICDIERMINCLEQHYNVKSLTLHHPALLRVLSESSRELKPSHIQFGNLRYLKVSTPLEKNCLPAIIYLLKSSPKIDTFVIQILSREVYLANKFENWAGEKLSLKHLKSIEVRGVEGSDNELEFLKVLLKKAVILQKFTVFTASENFSDHKNQGRLKYFADELCACFPASLNVQIIFKNSY